MREHKFRGIEKDTGKFVYGDLIQTLLNKHCGGVSAWIKPKTILGLGAICTMTENFSQVDPETVGEYTGLKDCDGVEIYEGDITKDKEISQSLYDTGKYVYGVIEFIDGRYVDVYRYDGEEYHEEIHNVVVIGNIHQTRR